MDEKPRGIRLRWSLWVVYAALWTAALLTQLPIAARDAILPSDLGFPLGKVLHVVAYTVFTILTASLPLAFRRRWVLLGFLSLHAMVTEYLQQFVDRTGTWRDVGLDHLGIAVGVILTWRRWFSRHAK